MRVSVSRILFNGSKSTAKCVLYRLWMSTMSVTFFFSLSLVFASEKNERETNKKKHYQNLTRRSFTLYVRSHMHALWYCRCCCCCCCCYKQFIVYFYIFMHFVCIIIVFFYCVCTFLTTRVLYWHGKQLL